MLKGVNKQIIEITDTGNRYIQKAILFVSPEKNGYDPAFLMHQARKYVEQTQRGKDIKSKRRSFVSRFLWSLFYLGLGAGSAVVVTMLIR